MLPISLPGKISLIALLCTFGLSIILLGVEVTRSRDLSTAQKLAWVLALAIGTFFTAVIYFAQGRTGKLGRIASVLMAAGIAVALGTIVVFALSLRIV